MNDIDFEKMARLIVDLPILKLGKIVVSAFALSFIVSSLAGYYFINRTTLPSESAAVGGPMLAPSGYVDFDQNSLSEEKLSYIYKRNLFNREGLFGDPLDGSAEGIETQMTGRLIKSALPLKLEGLIFGGTPFTGLAVIINQQSSKLNSFIVGETVYQGAVLYAVLKDRIILDNSGSKEYLMLEIPELKRYTRTPGRRKSSTTASGVSQDRYSEDGFEREGDKIAVTEAYKQRMLTDDFTKVLQDAKASPHMVDGQIAGFVLERIRPDSIYEKAGFVDGDIVEEINGVPLTNVAGAIRLLQSIREDKNFRVKRKRGGNSTEIRIDVK